MIRLKILIRAVVASLHFIAPLFAIGQNELWRQGRYRPQPFSRKAVLEARAHRLLLVP